MTFGAFMTIYRSAFNDYLTWVFNSLLFEAQSGAFMSSTINQLTTSTLNAMEVPFPPKNERQAISEFLASQVTEVDQLIAEAVKAVALLGERRTALISAAVTGKIDVRGAAPAAAEAA
jgi:type I restriction enzyme S subunit